MTMPTMTSIHEFGRRLRAGETSSRETVEACLRRIEEDNGRLNAFIHVMAAEAREQARQLDRELADGHDRGPDGHRGHQARDVVLGRGIAAA